VKIGTTTSSFPNLLFVNGPNTVAPWASIIRGFEHQAIHNLKIVRHIHSQIHSYNHPPRSIFFRWLRPSSDQLLTPSTRRYALMPRPEAEAAWTEAMQSELDTLATSPRFGPGFYYLNAEGRNTFFWPFSQWYYWYRTRGFQLEDYVFWDGRKEV